MQQEELKTIMAAAFSNYIGPGSSDKNKTFFKEQFPRIAEEYGIKSVNDAGCGLGWIKGVCEGIEYNGFDILPRENYVILDITSEVMPKADLIICRDVLFHLTNKLVTKAISNFKESGSRYLLATSCYNADNKKRSNEFNGTVIQSVLDLTEMLGQPLNKIEEHGLDRFMGLWKL